MNTTIAISSSTRDQIREFGSKGETYDEILSRLLRSAKDRQLQELLMDVVLQEGYFPDGILDEIIKQAEGKPRNALHELQKAIAAGKLKKMPYRFSVEEALKNTQSAFEQISRNAEIEDIEMTKEE